MLKFPDRFRPYRRLALDLLLVSAIAIAVVAALWLLNRWLVDATTVGQFGVVVNIIQPLVTAKDMVAAP